MAEDQGIDRSEFLALTAEIVAAHAGSNAVARAELATLIQSVFQTLHGLGDGRAVVSVELTPAVPITRSVTDDYIVCLEDGRKLKMLKRHLMTETALTPEQYRTKWGLKPDYPMVAPNYSVQRQTLRSRSALAASRPRRRPRRSPRSPRAGGRPTT